MCLQKTLDIPEGTGLVSNRKVPTASQAPEAVFVAVGNHSLNKWSSVQWTQTNGVGTIPKLSHKALAMSLSLPTAEGCLHAGACRCPCPLAGRHLLGASHLCSKCLVPFSCQLLYFCLFVFSIYHLPFTIHISLQFIMQQHWNLFFFPGTQWQSVVHRSVALWHLGALSRAEEVMIS